jgi:hypothetical protein
MSYHHPRTWRHDPSDRWRSVGVDNQILRPWCQAVAAGRIASIQVRLANGQVVTVRRSQRANIRAMLDNAQRLDREYTREAVEYVPRTLCCPAHRDCTRSFGHYGPCAASGRPLT